MFVPDSIRFFDKTAERLREVALQAFQLDISKEASHEAVLLVWGFSDVASLRKGIKDGPPSPYYEDVVQLSRTRKIESTRSHYAGI